MIAIYFDYIIVGGGSSGCVLANRLSQDPRCRVLLLEAGPIDGGLMLEVPLAFSMPLANDRYNWAYYTEPEPYMDGRRMYCPRGRVLGGSSSINGMVWLRGNPQDYDNWADAGLPGWSYAHCLPYFKRSETRERGGDAYRGDSGPMRISTGACHNPLFGAFMEAGVQAGYPYTEDMNGYQQEGFGPKDMSVHKGSRWSAARGYADEIRSKPNFKRELESLVTRILFDGKRAVGIEYQRFGISQKVFADKEVIICGGAINTPQLLMLSGVGPAAHLRDRDVKVVADLPGVGSDLQDHLDLYIQYECKQPVSLYPATRPLGKAKAGLQWLLARKGVAASNQFEAGGFIRSRAGVPYPDLQYHFMPIAASYDQSVPPTGHGFQAFLSLMRPTSRGSVRLRSADPKAAPVIQFNYCSTEEDRRTMRDGVRLTRELMAQSAFDSFRGAELAPGESVQTDAEIDAFVRAKTETEYHPSSTCRMGVDDDAVVDANGCVYGIEGLRIADASTMPSVVTANLNATVIMMAEMFADRILGKPQLSALEVPTFRAQNYASAQR